MGVVEKVLAWFYPYTWPKSITRIDQRNRGYDIGRSVG
jgi:hypothetical protein